MSEQVEVDRLRAEVEHWKAHAEEAGEGFSRVCKDYARASARNSEFVRRVEALADEWERRCDAVAITYQDAGQRLRATSTGRTFVRDLRGLLGVSTQPAAANSGAPEASAGVGEGVSHG